MLRPILCLLVLLSLPAAAQILDDSTRQVYGPSTTGYRLERDLFNGIDTVYTLDTSYFGGHNYEFAWQPPYYHHLGELGTAAQPLFYPLPEVGHRLGVNVYDLYAYDNDDVRYFDTRSPFTSLYYVQGTRGQQWLTVDFSRNVTPRWNVGLRWRRLSSDRQIAPSTNRRVNTRADHHAVIIETSYASEDGRYRLVGNYRHLNHFVFESGGLLLRPGDDQEDLLRSVQAQTELERLSSSAITRDRRNNFHVYHQYDLTPTNPDRRRSALRPAQLFHVLDRHWQRFSYNDDELGFAQSSVGYTAGTDFYPNRYFDSTLTSHPLYYSDWENTLGIKGRLTGLQYSLFFFRRDLRLDRPRLDPAYTRAENYGGATLKYFINDTNYVETEARYELGGSYRFTGRFVTNWFNVEWIRQRTPATFVQQFYLGNHFA
ncbi:MAG: putative porin, partial [Catalinimonas sp.]